MSIVPFPFALLRLAGAPLDELQRLDLPAEAARQAERRRLQQKLTTLGAEIADALRALIPTVSDKPKRRRLLRIRRDVYNGRPIDPSDSVLEACALTRNLRNELRHYRRLSDRLSEQSDSFASLYQDHIPRQSESLLKLADNRSFRCALALASPALHDRLESQLSHPEREIRKRHQFELGLLRYLARFHAKTSPFSSFTHVGKVCLETTQGSDRPFTQLWPRGTLDLVSRARSQVRPNSSILRCFEELLVQREDLREVMGIRLNTTLVRVDEGYRFLSTRGNINVFQKVGCHPALDLLLGALDYPERSSFRTYGDVSAEVVAAAQGAFDRQSLDRFMKRLWAVGLLDFDLGVSPRDANWPRALADRLSEADNLPAVAGLIDALRRLDHAQQTLADAPPQVRRKLLATTNDVLLESYRELLSGVDEESESTGSPLLASDEDRQDSVVSERALNASTEYWFRPSLSPSWRSVLFYEDSAVDDLELRNPELPTVVTALARLVTSLDIFDYRLDDRELMLAFLEKRFGADADVPLLEYYEAYFREVEIPMRRRNATSQRVEARGDAGDSDFEQDREPGGRGPAEQEDLPWWDYKRIPGIARRNAQRAQFLKLFQELVADRDWARLELPISTNELELIRHRTQSFNSYNRVSQERSCSAFLQFQVANQDNSSTDRKSRWIVNHYWPGSGRAFSRFLHLFDDGFTKLVKENNSRLRESFHLVELDDALRHNVILHPPLTACALEAPGVSAVDEFEEVVSVNDLVVRQASHGIDLVNSKSGLPAATADLSFMTPFYRSTLLKLLERFSKDGQLSDHRLVEQFHELGCRHEACRGDSDGVRRIPRLVLDGNIVLSRSMWVVESEHLPTKRPGEDQAGYYERVRDWRMDCGIPSRAFVAIGRTPEAMPSKADDYKPQYISFDSPIFVELFSRIASRCSTFLRVTELFPDTSAGEVVSELVVQFQASAYG